MRVVIVYLSAGGLSGGAVKTLRRQLPLFRGDPRIESVDVFLPRKSLHVLDARDNPRTWPALDPLCGFPWLRHAIGQLHPDVVFIPTATCIDCRGIPVVCMVRNTEPLVEPIGGNSLQGIARNLLLVRNARAACRQATRVIAVSRFVQTLLIDRWTIPPGKIPVVYHGVESPHEVRRAVRPSCLRGYRVGSFWLSAGSLRSYRGLKDAISALAMRDSDDEYLCIAGSPLQANPYHQRMLRLANRLGVGHRVRWLGHCSQEEMSWCFTNCRAFIMTSRMEACPNIVLESLSHGCLSISTTRPPMPEFYQDTALYYDAGDVMALRAAMDRVTAMACRERLSRQASAQHRAEQFSWESNFDATVRELENAAAAGKQRKIGRRAA